MDFTAWNWASSFRLHEAACLIAGVMPISKRHPISEELPPQARPILIKLAGAYYEWFFQKKNPERPKSIVLEGILNEDGSLPPFPALADVAGEVVSRDDLHRFLTLMAECGLKSCYDFGPVGKADPPHEIGHQTQAAATAPGVANGTSNVPRKARRDLLTPVIEAAQKACGNVNDAPAVWAKLTQMAENGQRPLLGVSDDGIKWQDANDEPQFFKLRNLRDRLRRSSTKAL